jgi:glutamate 5-kinase
MSGMGEDVRFEGRRLPAVRRFVVKVGTSSLVGHDSAISPKKLNKVAIGVADAWNLGRDCVLVSSGAIASGLAPLALRERPRRLPALQAAAAVGQSRLMAEYARSFAKREVLIAQVLLTEDDFARRTQFVNAQRTFEHLLAARVVPIVNENDTVATEEITFGDNDRLAALVAIMVKADLLILLSDVDGIYTRQPGLDRSQFVPEVPEGLLVEATGPRSPLGSGGMASKIEAAGLATAAGIPTIVANAAQKEVLPRILAGEPLGTWIPARGQKRHAREAWIAFASSPRGRVHVDQGAQQAVREGGKSLLMAGVIGVRGNFGPGDPIDVVGPDGIVFARGITRFSSRELADRSAPRHSSIGNIRNGPSPRYREVIHRDHLALIGQRRGELDPEMMR